MPWIYQCRIGKAEGLEIKRHFLVDVDSGVEIEGWFTKGSWTCRYYKRNTALTFLVESERTCKPLRNMPGPNCLVILSEGEPAMVDAREKAHAVVSTTDYLQNLHLLPRDLFNETGRGPIDEVRRSNRRSSRSHVREIAVEVIRSLLPSCG